MYLYITPISACAATTKGVGNLVAAEHICCTKALLFYDVHTYGNMGMYIRIYCMFLLLPFVLFVAGNFDFAIANASI